MCVCKYKAQLPYAIKHETVLIILDTVTTAEILSTVNNTIGKTYYLLKANVYAAIISTLQCHQASTTPDGSTIRMEVALYIQNFQW